LSFAKFTPRQVVAVHIQHSSSARRFASVPCNAARAIPNIAQSDAPNLIESSAINIFNTIINESPAHPA